MMAAEVEPGWLKIPPEVAFWATYDFLYGGVYEQVIARHNGYSSAEAMRNAKYEEWKQSRKAMPGNTMTYEELVSAYNLLRSSNRPAKDGHYHFEVHHRHVQEATMLLNRLRYPGGRKARRAWLRIQVYIRLGIVKETRS